MDEKTAPSQTQMQKGSLQRVEASMDNLGGIQKHCLSIQGQVRKAKAQMELNLSRDIKNNKEGFCMYTCDIRMTGENVGPLYNETGDLSTQNMEEAEVLNAAFASVFTSKTSLQESQVPETREKSWSEEEVPSLEEDHVREYLSNLDIQKSMGPYGMHPQVLRELADVIVRTLNNLWLIMVTRRSA